MRRLSSRAVAVAVATVAAIALSSSTAAGAPPPAAGITVRPGEVHQGIDGFGYATAFGRAKLVYDLPPAQQRQVLGLLLDPQTGAAPSILRLGIDSGSDVGGGNTIEPNDPGGPDAPPQYVWDGFDAGQVWFAKQARQRGIGRFYAEAWSAPGYMKDNRSERDGGQLCGLQGTTCSADWRAAYARYLVRFADFYRQEGIRIADLGFTNEPDYTTKYSSMRFTPAQAAEMLGVLGPIAQRAGYGVNCCDSFGWRGNAQPYADAIAANPQARPFLDRFTGHSYAARSDAPLNAPKPTWMSEWAPSSEQAGWTTAWDSGAETDGLAVAEHIQDSLTAGNVSAYLYWYGVSSGATASMVRVTPGTDQVDVSSRLYAFSAFSRYVRPGAVRIGADTTLGGQVKVSAFRNRDGRVTTEVLNLSAQPLTTSISGTRPGRTLLTDATHNLQDAPTVAKPGPGGQRLTLPPRSLVTLVG